MSWPWPVSLSPPSATPSAFERASRAWAWSNAHCTAEWLRPLLPPELRREVARYLYISHELCVHQFAPCRICEKFRCRFCGALYKVDGFHGAPDQPPCSCPPRRVDPGVLASRCGKYAFCFAQDVPELHRLWPNLYEGIYAPWYIACYGWDRDLPYDSD